jgi:hypothetical protein
MAVCSKNQWAVVLPVLWKYLKFGTVAIFFEKSYSKNEFFSFVYYIVL